MPDTKFMDYLHKLDALVEKNPSLLTTASFQQELKEDFRIFMWFTWKEAFGFTPHNIQLEFASIMQSSLKDKAVIVMALRRFGKTLTDATFIDWFLFCDPNRTVLVVSANKDRSKEITGTALALLNACEFLSHMLPSNKDLDGRLAFTVGSRTLVQKEASCVAASIKGGNTGSHADLILSDDIEIPKNSDTQTKREEIMKGVDEYTYIRNDDATELFIGTPQTEDSVYFKLQATGEYVLHRVPSEYPDPANDKQMNGLAQFLLDDLRNERASQGDPTYPERFDEYELAKAKAKSPSSYSLQMMLDPSASDETKYPLKLKDFIVMDLSPQWGPLRVMWNTVSARDDIESVGLGKDKFYSPAFVDWTPTQYQHGVLAVDPAGNGPDEVGWCVGKNIHGNVFITAAGGIDGGYDDATLRKLCKIAIEQGVKEIVVEKNFADGMYGKNLGRVLGEMGLRIPITDYTAKGQKEVRIIETIEPALANHKLIIDSKVAKDQILMNQLTRVTRDRGSLVHDDRLDAFAICVDSFTDVFLVDTDKMLKQTQEDDFQDEIQGFLNQQYGDHNKSKTLFSNPNKSKTLRRYGMR